MTPDIAVARPGPRRIRLLTFTTLFYIGGTERHLMHLTNGLDHTRFALEFGCLKRAGEFLPAIEARGIPVVEYPVTRLYGFHALAEQFRFYRALRAHGIEIVHTYNFHPNLFALVVARLARTPVVIASIRDTGMHLTRLQRFAQRIACRFAHHILVNADAVKQALVADGYAASGITVIRNGLDVAAFVPSAPDPELRRELGIPADAPIVAMLARLDRQKGAEDFLDAAARVVAVVTDARFLIIGGNAFTAESHYRAELEARAARLGIADRVVFTGFRLDVPRLLAQVSVSVLPSLSEGLSNTLLESMAAGVPVVATRVGGNPEVVQDGATGWLVAPKDPHDLARAILSILQSPDIAQSFSRRARARVEEHFSLERMVRDTALFYERALIQASAQVDRHAARADARQPDKPPA